VGALSTAPVLRRFFEEKELAFNMFQHFGGWIYVESGLNPGASFSFTLVATV
jgi:hypothetical protein